MGKFNVLEQALRAAKVKDNAPVISQVPDIIVHHPHEGIFQAGLPPLAATPHVAPGPQSLAAGKFPKLLKYLR